MLMCVSANEDITVQLSLNGSEGFHVTPRNNLMSMNDSNLKVVDLNDLSLRKACNFITVATHDMRLAFCGSQVLEPLDSLYMISESEDFVY